MHVNYRDYHHSVPLARWALFFHLLDEPIIFEPSQFEYHLHFYLPRLHAVAHYIETDTYQSEHMPALPTHDYLPTSQLQTLLDLAYLLDSNPMQPPVTSPIAVPPRRPLLWLALLGVPAIHWHDHENLRNTRQITHSEPLYCVISFIYDSLFERQHLFETLFAFNKHDELGTLGTNYGLQWVQSGGRVIFNSAHHVKHQRLLNAYAIVQKSMRPSGYRLIAL